MYKDTSREPDRTATSRREFLHLTGGTLMCAAVAGCNNTISIVPADGQFESTKTQEPERRLRSTERGPKIYKNLRQAVKDLGAPANARYVTWDPEWPVKRDLEDVFATELRSGDILVLPERKHPYLIDSSEGFRASGVSAVMGRNGRLPVINRYKQRGRARTWFGMARARLGVIGLGPESQIEMSDSDWSQERQIQDKGSKHIDGWISTGRYYIDDKGVRRHELVGCQEKVLEADDPDAFFANFSMRSHDLGGIAFNAIALNRGKSTFKQLDLSGAWSGFQSVPNGEAGAASVHTGTYLIEDCIFDGRGEDGKRMGTSPVMINSTTGGRVQNTLMNETYAGQPTIWNSTGHHVWENADSRFNRGHGINLEKCQEGMTVEIIGGSLWPDYQGNGGEPNKPDDQGKGGSMHIGLYTENGSAKVTLRGVDVDDGPTPGSVCVQSYGDTTQRAADIKAFDAKGKPMPVKIYGDIR